MSKLEMVNSITGNEEDKKVLISMKYEEVKELLRTIVTDETLEVISC